MPWRSPSRSRSDRDGGRPPTAVGTTDGRFRAQRRERAYGHLLPLAHLALPPFKRLVRFETRRMVDPESLDWSGPPICARLTTVLRI